MTLILRIPKFADIQKIILSSLFLYFKNLLIRPWTKVIIIHFLMIIMRNLQVFKVISRFLRHILQAFHIFRLTGLVFIDLNFVLVNKNAKKNCNTYVLVCSVTVGYSGGMVERSSLFKTTNTSPPQGRCTQQMFIRGGSAPRSNILPFYIPFFTKKVPLSHPAIDKWYPFHIHCLELCIPFNCCKCTVF